MTIPPAAADWKPWPTSGENEYLHSCLCQADPVSGASIHPNNRKRVIRALEYYEKTGRPISAHNEQERQKESPYQYAYFVLNEERGRLYEKIEQRIDQMMERGLLEEVKALHRMGYTKDMVSMQGLGYKELLSYLDGTCSLEEAVYTLKRDTRHFCQAAAYLVSAGAGRNMAGKRSI